MWHKILTMTSLIIPIHALTLAFIKIITVANQFTVSVEIVDIVSCDEERGVFPNGAAKSRRKSAVANAGTVIIFGPPDPSRVREIEHSDMAVA